MKEKIEELLNPILELQSKQKELSNKIMKLSSEELDIIIEIYNTYIDTLIKKVDSFNDNKENK